MDQPTPGNRPRYYTITDIARICGVTRATIDRWHRDRADFPRKVLLGANCARFKADEMDAWLDAAPTGSRHG
jgi:predicted DNA-binding transcriptional regulator AlpA